MDRLPRVDDDEEFTIAGKTWNKIATAVENALNMSVAAPLEMTDLGNGNRALAIRPQNRTGFWAWATAVAQDGTNFRWSYTFAEVEQTGATWAGWATKTGGATGTMYNAIEVGNLATGLFGNGVNSTNLTGTFALQPLPTGRPVWVRVVYSTTGVRQYWFEYASGVDGGCP